MKGFDNMNVLGPGSTTFCKNAEAAWSNNCAWFLEIVLLL